MKCRKAQNNEHRKNRMMAALNRHLGWIQLLLTIGGLIFIYGQQVQSMKDIERRTTQCEVDNREQNVSTKEIMNAVYDIKGDIKEIKAELKYISRRSK